MRKRPKLIWIELGLLVAVLLTFAFKPYVRSFFSPVIRHFTGNKTVEQRLQQFGEKARARLKPAFEKAGVQYPPSAVILVGLKAEERLEVYAADEGGAFHYICAYPILAASGHAGPKLREGDLQVPEGIYPIESLNPNSRFHVSLRIGYPNEFDRSKAQLDGRTNLGGDIMIHGSSVSVGCLAMGDRVAEDLFVLAADTGLDNLTAILAPVDFREGRAVAANADLPEWTETLYAQIKTRLVELPLPPAP